MTQTGALLRARAGLDQRPKQSPQHALACYTGRQGFELERNLAHTERPRMSSGSVGSRTPIWVITPRGPRSRQETIQAQTLLHVTCCEAPAEAERDHSMDEATCICVGWGKSPML